MEQKKPLEFKARIEIKDGKKHVVIDSICEEIKREDGGQDVIVHVPSLSLINSFKQLHSIE